MNWLADLNAAMAYIDEHLQGRLDLHDVARAASCSEFQLQRMFPYLAGVSLAEYVRRRKMSQAAVELRSSNIKVIDLATRYGYDSPTAFTRAFQAVHGVSPSAARSGGARLTAYPRLTFTLSVSGEEPMDYKIIERPAFRVVGIQTKPEGWGVRDAGEKATDFWTQIGPRVHEVLDCMDGSEPQGLLGVQFCVDGEFDGYMACVATQAPCPEGLVERTVPAATYAVFECFGPIPEAMQKLWHRILTEWLPSSGYEWETMSDVERYFGPNPTGPDYRSEVWLPVRIINRAV